MIVLSLSSLNKDLINQANIKKNIDLIEIRSDLFTLDEIFKSKKLLKKPLIFTLKKEDINFFNIKILRKINFDYIDLEYSRQNYYFIQKIKKNFPDKKIILSFHSFEKNLNLEKIFLQMKPFNPNIYKIAIYAHSSIDSLKMVLFTKKIASKYNFCGIAMGEKGIITRILYKNSYFCYVYLNKKTAPGQLDLNTLKKRYKADKINKNTSIFALIGNPINYSPSHITHNKIFSLTKTNAVYIKIPLEKKELFAFFQLIKTLNFKGISVTYPLKKEVLKFIIKKKNISSANTLVKRKNGWEGYNTDGKGAILAIEKKIQNNIFSIKKINPFLNKKILILGAGNTAQIITKELKKRGAKITFFNRTYKKAKLLSKELKCNFLKNIEDGLEKDFDILINATSIRNFKSFFPKKLFLNKKIIFDVNISYKKISFKNTIFISGFEMFIYQAKEQFKIWFLN